MARSFSNVKALSALVVENFSLSFASRRSYSAAASSQGVAVSASRAGAAARIGGGVSKKVPKEESAENSWVPDPVTGYYRPANMADEIDVAELRRELLKNRTVSR